jgi:hypothetical protein
MKRLAQIVALAFALTAAAVAHAELRGRQITAELKRDLGRRVEKAKWSTRLGGKPGDKMRPFTASSIRHITIPGNAPNGALGGARVAVGWMISGKISTKTGRTTIQGRSQPRSAPTPPAQQ